MLIASEVYHGSATTISVDPSNGRDDPRCLVTLSGIPCATLGYALLYGNHSALYLLSTGSEHSLATGVNTIANLRNVTVASNGSSSTVRCVTNAGLVFENVSSLTIENVVFLGCGALRNGTSRNLSDTDSPYSLLKLKVALYFYLCDFVSLLNVTVANSTAIGVVMYDTTGRNLISNSVFSDNVAQDMATPGGGGFYVEFTYTAPGDTCTPLPLPNRNTGSVYDFVNCTFSRNVAGNGAANDPKFIIPHGCNHNTFGKGGGLAVFFKDTASDNTIKLSNCTFENNIAVWGGGVYVEFHDAAAGNVIEIQSTFLGNSANFEGGGLRVAYYYPSNTMNILANNFTMWNSNLVNNSAFAGGAITFMPSSIDLGTAPQTLFFNCSFEGNRAELGSAIYSTDAANNIRTLEAVINFIACIFTNNILTVDNRKASHYIGVGAVYLNGVPAKFYGVIVFQQNSGSALAIMNAYVDFASCNISFLNNTGDKGGAISLIAAASIIVGKETNARFVGNTATSYGGAIYNSYVERESLSFYANCFIQYNDFAVPPDQWTAHFVFRNNSAMISGDSIYSTSILPCSIFTATPNQSQTVFCWNRTYWDYDDSCTSEIRTGFGQISFSTAQTFPGVTYQLPINITDELGHNILAFTAFIATINTKKSNPVAEVDPNFYVVANGVLQINGNGSANETLILSLDGTLAGNWHSEIEVRLLPCPPGLSQTINGSKSICQCDPNKTYNSVIICLGSNSGNTFTLIKSGYWIGFDPKSHSGGLVVAACPQGFCTSGKTGTDKYIALPTEAGKLSSVICAPNRVGVLCGECIEKYAPSVNDDSYSCVPCNRSQLIGNILIYVGVVYVPLVIFFLVIILFNVKLTTGPANAFILFSQAIVTTFNLTVGGQLNINGTIYHGVNTFFKVCSFIYRIFNLDFFSYLMDPFCVGSQLNTLDIIELNYIVAIVPCVMILIVIVCYQITKLTCILALCGCITKPSNEPTQKMACTKAISVSPILAFAAFLLLSYNKVSVTASKILSQTRFRDASGTTIAGTRSFYAAQVSASDWRYALPSSIVSILIIALPIVLLGFPVRWFEKCIGRAPAIMKYYPADKVNIFLDAFQGCFRDNRRYFASAYFFFRLFVNVALVFLPTLSLRLTCQLLVCIAMIVLIAFLQPYKVAAYNYVDILFFSNLAFINAINAYIVQTNNDLDQLDATNGLLVILSFLTSLPLVYMGGYIIWHFLVEPRKVKVMNALSQLIEKYVTKKKSDVPVSINLGDISIKRSSNGRSVYGITTVSDDDVIDARMREQIDRAAVMS